MKQYLHLLGALVLSFSTAEAQYQLANGDFEDWEQVKVSYESGVIIKTTKTVTSNEPVSWNTYGTVGGSLFSSAISAEKSGSSNDVRPGSTGSKSAWIKASEILSIVANGVLTTGRIEASSITASSTDNHNITIRSNEFDKFTSVTPAQTSSMEFTGVPDSFRVWLKYVPVDASNLARVSVILHGDYDTQDPGAESEQVVATATANVNCTSDKGWQCVTIPFFSVNAENEEGFTATCKDYRPSYALIGFSTNCIAAKGDANDSLYIDDIEMVYNSKLSMLMVDGEYILEENVYDYEVDGIFTDPLVDYDYSGRATKCPVSSYDTTTSIYTIRVEGDNISSDSTNYHVYRIKYNSPSDPSSISEYSFDKNSVVYSNSTLYVDESLVGMPYCIYSAEGVLMQSGIVSDSTVSTNQLPKGFYLFKMDGNSTVKFVQE